MQKRRLTCRGTTDQGVTSVRFIDCKRIVNVGTVGIPRHPRKAPVALGGVGESGVPAVSADLVSHDVPTLRHGWGFDLAATLLARRIAQTPA